MQTDPGRVQNQIEGEFMAEKRGLMDYRIVYNATWLCGHCGGLSPGSELLVPPEIHKPGCKVMDLAYDAIFCEGDAPQGPMLDPDSLFCPNCVIDDLTMPTVVEQDLTV